MPKTYLVDYPEARRVFEHLRDTRGLRLSDTWTPFGTRPETLRSKLRPVPDQPFLVINGSGNYHHETYAVVEGVCRQGSCAYVHIDAHPDKDTYFRWKLDCASFVGAILEIPEVTEGVLLGLHIGKENEDLPGIVLGNDLHYYRFDYFSKLRQYNARPSPLREFNFRYSRADGVKARRNPSVQSARVERLPKNDRKADRGLAVVWRDIKAFDPASIVNDRVYLSVDLDVLRRDIVTDWRREGPDDEIADNQGTMTLKQLLSLLRKTTKGRHLVGADLCGLTSEFAALAPSRLEQSLATITAVYDVLQAALSASDGGDPREPSPASRRR